MLLLRVPFAPCVEIGLDLVDERPAVLRAVVGVDSDAGTLVHQQDLAVLINHMQLRRRDLFPAAVRRGLFKVAVVQIQADDVAVAQPLAALGPLAVDLDILGADALLHQGGGKQWRRLTQEAVQALPGVVPSDDKFLHAGSFTLCPRC